MSELPQGWATTPLGELVSSIVGGGTPSKSNAEYFRGAVPFMTVKDMHARFIVDTQDHITEDALVDSASRLIPADTLVVASRMSLGKIARPTVPVAINQDLKALFLREGIDKTYVEYAWRAKESEIQGMGTGTTVKGIRLEDIRRLDIALAPSGEQTRIANQLDTLLTRVQACNDRFDAIPALLKRFRQTVLDAATSGRLTEDWRGLDDLKLGKWEAVALQDVITEMRNGLAQKPTESPPGSKILRIGAVRSGQLNLDDHRYLVVSDKEAEQYALKRDDLLFTRYNGSLEFVGVCAALTHDAPGYVYPDKLIRVRVRGDRAIAKFIEIAFGCRRMRTQVESFVKSSAGQRGVSGADLKAAKFSLPPITEQSEIVRRVEALFALADRIEARCTAARTQAQRLTPLVLAKAFRGELVPQDPNDEPASALLARIQPQGKLNSASRAVVKQQRI